LLTGLLLTVGACSPNCNSKPVSLTASSPASAPTPLAQPTSPAISGLPLHEGEVGIGYAAATLGATGGKTPYQWSISGGAIPPGLSLSPDGNVSGTPTSPGVFNFTVQVAEAAGGTTTSSSTVTIRAALAAGLLSACAQYCSVEQGCANACGNFGTLSGGAPPFTYSLVPGGFVPAGVTLNELSLAGTFIAQAKFWQFTVNVTDALGATTSISPTFYVFPHVSLASGSCSGNYNTGCTVRLPISGGTPNGTSTVALVSRSQNPNPGCWTPSATQPPTGYGLTVGGGYVTVTIPSRLINGYGAVWTLVLTDQSLCAPGLYCTSAAATVTIGVQCG
jgi:hypothetical protein